MYYLMLVLNIVNVLGFAAAAALGLVVGERWYGDPAVRDRLMFWHTTVGLFSSLFALFVHGFLVFTYFIGTGIAVKEALKDNGLSLELFQPTRRFKARVFPIAFFAVMFTVAGTVVGGGVASHWIPTWVHVSLIGLGLLLNLWAIPVEVRVCRENAELMNRVDDLVVATRAAGNKPG